MPPDLHSPRPPSDLADVKLFLYRVVDSTFTPPAETDSFERLDKAMHADGNLGTMTAQEDRAGLNLMAGVPFLVV